MLCVPESDAKRKRREGSSDVLPSQKAPGQINNMCKKIKKQQESVAYFLFIASTHQANHCVHIHRGVYKEYVHVAPVVCWRPKL